jgi:hypothetical protein
MLQERSSELPRSMVPGAGNRDRALLAVWLTRCDPYTHFDKSEISRKHR